MKEGSQAPTFVARAELPVTTLQSLREHNKPADLIIYVNEGHIKNQPKHGYEIYPRNVDWFNFLLQEKEDSNSTKADQYKRWRELKKLQEKKVLSQ